MIVMPIWNKHPTKWKTAQERAIERIAENCIRKFKCSEVEAKNMAKKIYKEGKR